MDRRAASTSPWARANPSKTVFPVIIAVNFILFDNIHGGVIFLLIVLSAFAMGVQSAAVQRLGVPGIATTYITGTLTSLMVDLLGWLRSIAARLPVSRTAERGKIQRIPWDQRVRSSGRRG